MRQTLTIAAVLCLTAVGCGREIGDECVLSTDCSVQGDRICDIASPGGYCTVLGCDYNTCPDESVCIRFFSLAESNIMCDPATEDLSTNDCTADEICTLTGSCMPRSAEFRFCMRRCESGGDCRDGYECRNGDLMREHGGEPVPRPGERVGDRLPAFCATAPQ